MKKLALRMAKIAIAWHMHGHGYSKEQRVRLIGALGDGTIWNIIKKYGPIILSIFVKYILPLLLALEQPHDPPIKDYWLDEEEETLVSAVSPNADDTDIYEEP